MCVCKSIGCQYQEITKFSPSCGSKALRESWTITSNCDRTVQKHPEDGSLASERLDPLMEMQGLVQRPSNGKTPILYLLGKETLLPPTSCCLSSVAHKVKSHHLCLSGRGHTYPAGVPEPAWTTKKSSVSRIYIWVLESSQSPEFPNKSNLSHQLMPPALSLVRKWHFTVPVRWLQTPQLLIHILGLRFYWKFPAGWGCSSCLDWIAITNSELKAELCPLNRVPCSLPDFIWRVSLDTDTHTHTPAILDIWLLRKLPASSPLPVPVCLLGTDILLW